MADEMAQSDRQRSGVKVIRNTKGWSLEIHVYNDDPLWSDTIDKLHETVAELDAKYPRGDA